MEPYEENEPDYVPHYLTYEEELKKNVIKDLVQLTGVPFPQRPQKAINSTFSKDENFLPDNFIPDLWAPADNYFLKSQFIQDIVNSGRKQDAIKFLDLEISELTLHLQENNGRVTPMDFDNSDQEEDFWSEDPGPVTSWQEVESYEYNQRLEIRRLHRKWLIDLRKSLALEQENKQTREPLRIAGGIFKSQFIYKKDVNEFLTGPDFDQFYQDFNVIIFAQLSTMKGRGKGEKAEFYVPINFFNFLYEQLDIMIRHREKPEEVINHLKSYEISEIEWSFLCLHLMELLVIELHHKKGNAIEDLYLKIYIKLIEEENIKLSMRLFNTAYIFEHKHAALDICNTADEKIIHLLHWISDCKRSLIGASAETTSHGETFIKRCELEIEKIKRKRSEGFHFPTREQTAAFFAQENNPGEILQNNNKLLKYEGYSKDQVRDYFMQLKEQGFYSEEQVMHFLKANFIGFTGPGEVVEKVKLPTKTGLKQKDLNQLIYNFWYSIPTAKRKQDPWVQLLLDNFAYYEESDFDTVKKALARPSSNYPFSDIKPG